MYCLPLQYLILPLAALDWPLPDLTARTALRSWLSSFGVSPVLRRVSSAAIFARSLRSFAAAIAKARARAFDLLTLTMVIVLYT